MNIFATEQTEELQREAWAALRTHDLQHPARLTDALYDLNGGVAEQLAELLAALMSSERTETALDRVVLQHGAAMECIDRWVRAVVTAEEKQGLWRHFDETR